MDKVKHKILIIDDDEFLLDMYAVKFKEEGFEVEVAPEEKKLWIKSKKEFAPKLFCLMW